MIFKKPAVHVQRLSFDDFYIIEQVGEGTYGRVFKARNIHTNKLTALKVVFPTDDDEGLPFTAVREIKYLQMLSDNPNVIKLEGTFFTRDGELVLAFEYMENDLSGLLSLKNLQFSPAQTKCLFKQVLEGLHQCHRAGIMHRDIKAANLLLNNGELKMADFGLASNYLRRRTFSTNVVTLWYRAPELLLGVNAYGPKVDIWSAGCLLIELLTRQSPFPGREEKHQLELIVRTCGTPDERNWPGVTKLEGYKQLQGLMGHKNRLREVFGKFDPRALNLLTRMLSLNPADRPTASEALDHDYFWTDPLPCKAIELPHYPAMHEYEAKKTRQSERQPKRQRVTSGYAPNVPVVPLRSQPYPPHNAGYPPHVPLPVPQQPARGDYPPPLPSSHYAHLPYPASKPGQYGQPPARQNLPTGPQGWGPAAHGTHPPAAGDGLLPTPHVPLPAPGHLPRPTGYPGASSYSGSHPPSAMPHYDAARSSVSRHRQPHPHQQHRSSASSDLPPHHRSIGGAQPESSLPPSTGLRRGFHHAGPREMNRPPTSSARVEGGPRHDMPPHLGSGYNRPPAGAHRPVHHHASLPHHNQHLGHSIATDGHHASAAYSSVHMGHARATLSSVERMGVGIDTTGKRKREAAPLS